MEIAGEMVQSQTGLAEGPLLRGFFAQPGYATPKVDVRRAVIREAKILLVRERVDGLWRSTPAVGKPDQ